MLKIKVSDSSTTEPQIFQLSVKGRELMIDDQPFTGDLVRLNDHHFHLIWRHHSFDILVVEHSTADKSATLLINGVEIRTELKDELDLLLTAMGMQTGTAKKLNVLRAPMPGLIQAIYKAEGEHISLGDNLLVLVAMKMENVLKSNGSGTVKSIKVKAGDIVEKNQVLMEFQ
ncbi:acetyl-CoA carboxylase biotin carboxyl carrier protein subunit [Dyadobacter jejuensis]|nr:acetyl-CoA carboxylase biotin carboxyl carrier protein subunit [Dyadobacter jejuensis]